MTNIKITALEWQSAEALERIVAHMTFDNFDQTCRFIETVGAFILRERAAALAASTDTGSVT